MSEISRKVTALHQFVQRLAKMETETEVDARGGDIDYPAVSADLDNLIRGARELVAVDEEPES